MPWVLRKAPGAGAARDGTPALLAEGPVAEASRARAEADLARHQAAAARRAGESRWRAKQRAIRIWWWRAIWREVETARARVQQIARIVAKGQWRGRYPEVLIVEHATLLMELLYNQLEAQPPTAPCWGGKHTPVDNVPLVALASGLAGKMEELFHTGYVGTVDRGARCILRGAAEPSELPPPRITGLLLRPREQPPPELLPGGASSSDGATSRRFGEWPARTARCAQMLRLRGVLLTILRLL